MTSLLSHRPLRSRAAFAVVAVAALTLGLSGCATSGAGTPGGPNPVGTWGTVESTGVPFLTFTDNGQFTGSDGCNTLNGGWALNGTTIDFKNVATTLMACQGVDTWLSALNTATISGSTMTVFNSSNSEIGTLENATGGNGY
ncbi:META domain-containing protein [Microterricola viridarii]|nr:META domain-containing protein [Microterricola viridarii]